MNKAFFTKGTENEAEISSYIDITNKTFMDTVDDFLPVIQGSFPSFTIDPLAIISHIKNMTIQQRQLGALFHYRRQWNNLTFLVKAPVS